MSTAELLEAQELGEAHGHLHKDCPWYRHVDGEGGNGDPDSICKPATGKGGPPRLVVKFTADAVDWIELTPHTPTASTVHKPTVPPGGPGLFHIKGRQLPPYIQHLWHHLAPKYGKHRAYGMAVGIVKKWAEGINPGGYKTKSGKGKRTHADVRAAAAKNVAEWEKDKADAHKDKGHETKATASLAAPAVPGPHGQYGLWQNPAQQVAPGPWGPRTPETTLPTADECLSLAGQVPDSTDEQLSNTARVFLRAAGRKLELDDEQQALMALRGAQTALAAAHRADVNLSLPAQYGASVPAAERSSATNAMMQTRQKADQWRDLEVRTATMIDRMRKRFFHGQLNSQVANARLTGENMSHLDNLLALADASGHDVSEPVTSDLSARVTLMQPRGIAPASGKAQEELAGLPPLDRIKVQSNISKANSCLNTNRYTAAQALGMAKAAAAEAGAHHLARHIHQNIEVVAAMGNVTSAGPPSIPNTFDSHDAPQSGNRTFAATLALAATAEKVPPGKAVGGRKPVKKKAAKVEPPQAPAPDPLAGEKEANGHARSLHGDHLAHLQALHNAQLEHLERMHRASRK
jgi:hypothetical protein